MPKMDLPKPGESLFGKPSKNKPPGGEQKTTPWVGGGGSFFVGQFAYFLCQKAVWVDCFLAHFAWIGL